jgi:TolB-like protein/Flp pilus assembly protein TadD
MSRIIEGYEYDIFISYRQKDNKYDGWVTEFVDHLKKELEATFKEEVSVYFDINPHDGLLETHNVDASLKEKLKCLIFIPIVSQTYCDSKSFAWQYEFCAFNKLAKGDQFGRDIKLTSGNVTSRILPVKIHELDPEDKELLEYELGGVLRCVEFIYKSAGVNRPLRANEDHPQDNLNKTYYRDQINKVANAVKEIITSIKKHNQQDGKVSKDVVTAKPELPKKLNPKIIFASSLVLALLVLGYFFIPKLLKFSKSVEKSIAVLPFKNDSSNDSTTYFTDGVTEEILTDLQTVKDIRVISRTSVEQFRGPTKLTIPEIAKKLGVNYIAEGSGQKYGNTFVLRVQLIVGNNEKHLWGKSYDREMRETSDIISIQSEIAQSIASALKTTITPEEKQLINNIPTTNLTAYDFYQKGREEYAKYWNDNRNKEALQKAEDFYHTALKYDSTFAQAYCGLATVYWYKKTAKEYLSKNFMDSVLIYANIALSFNNKLSEAYTLRGKYYNETGKPEQSIEELNKAIELNPNDWMAYWEEFSLYYAFTDFVKLINSSQKAASLNHGPELPGLLEAIGTAYSYAGFLDKAKQYILDKFKLDGDSVAYYSSLSSWEGLQGNDNNSFKYMEKAYAMDTTNIGVLYALAGGYNFAGRYKESLKLYKKVLELLKAQEVIYIPYTNGIGYSFWQNGYKKEAEYYFNESIKNLNKEIELGRAWGAGLFTYWDLAGAYAFMGEKDKAYKNLRIFNQMQRVPSFMVVAVKGDPLFNSIRNEPEFQQIAKDIIAKYQAEHERARKWLEENNML